MGKVGDGLSEEGEIFKGEVLNYTEEKEEKTMEEEQEWNKSEESRLGEERER